MRFGKWIRGLQRKGIVKEIRYIRRRDKGILTIEELEAQQYNHLPHYRRGRSFEEINKDALKVGLDLRGIIDKKLGQKKTIAVLDAGCGNKNTLSDINRLFGERGKTEGISLSFLKGKPEFHSVDKYHVGLFEKHKFDNKFDLVYSVQGTTYHSDRPIAQLRKVLEILSPEGEAVLDFYSGPTSDSKIRRFLKNNKINFELRNTENKVFVHIF